MKRHSCLEIMRLTRIFSSNLMSSESSLAKVFIGFAKDINDNTHLQSTHCDIAVTTRRTRPTTILDCLVSPTLPLHSSIGNSTLSLNVFLFLLIWFHSLQNASCKPGHENARTNMGKKKRSPYFFTSQDATCHQLYIFREWKYYQCAHKCEFHTDKRTKRKSGHGSLSAIAKPSLQSDLRLQCSRADCKKQQEVLWDFFLFIYCFHLLVSFHFCLIFTEWKSLIQYILLLVYLTYFKMSMLSCISFYTIVQYCIYMKQNRALIIKDSHLCIYGINPQ